MTAPTTVPGRQYRQGGRIMETLDQYNHKGIDPLIHEDGILSQKIIEASSLPPNELSIDERYHHAAEDATVTTFNFETKQSSIRILYASELLTGHLLADRPFYDDVIARVKTMPKNERPQLIALSGIMQGNFERRFKTRRETLVLKRLDEQYKDAHDKLKAAVDTGIPVLYNMGNDDLEIARQNTARILHQLKNNASDLEKALSRHDENKARTLAEKAGEKYVKPAKEVGGGVAEQLREAFPNLWQKIFDSQVRDIFPFCMRSGRSLKNADEMVEATNGKIRQSEFFVLFNAFEAMHAGKKVPQSHRKWISHVTKDLSWLPESKLQIADDFNLSIKTKDAAYTDWFRHSLSFSPEPAYQDHMRTPIEILGHRYANNQSTPNLLVTQHNQELTGAKIGDNAWVISTGGMMNSAPFMEMRSSRNTAAGDIPRRQTTTRRRPSTPNANMIERTDEGTLLVTFFERGLMEKMDAIGERIAIAEVCDTQAGSITARFDLLVKYLDFIRTRVIGEYSTALFFGGDMMHGRNYPHFASESQATGLMAMDSQEKMMQVLFRGAFEGLSRTELSALDRVLVQPGNHEWNSGTLKQTGYTFVTYMRELFKLEFARTLGLTNEELDKKVRTHDAYVTPKGEYVAGYTGIEYFGEDNAFGALIQHYLQERGAKGNSGPVPAGHADGMIKGTAALMQNVDLLMAGHWHHPTFAMYGSKVSVVSGSMAGLSDYEQKRGYYPQIAGTIAYAGGGKPLQLEFIPDLFLHNYTIKKGAFTPERVAENHKDDPGFDPRRHGLWTPRTPQYRLTYPKSGLQHTILDIKDEVTARADSTVQII